MPHAYPIMLDVADRLIVIIGGGAVAKRKAVGLLAAGANRVRVVATQFDADFPAVWQRIEAPFDPSLLAGAQMVFIATDSAEVNEYAADCARKIGAIINRADCEDSIGGDFAIPAVFRRGVITVAISAGGAPSVAAALRDVVTGAIDAEWGTFALEIRQFRAQLRETNLSPDDRHRILRTAASPELISAYRRGGRMEWWIRLVEAEPQIGQLG